MLPVDEIVELSVTYYILLLYANIGRLIDEKLWLYTKWQRFTNGRLHKPKAQ